MLARGRSAGKSPGLTSLEFGSRELASSPVSGQQDVCYVFYLLRLRLRLHHRILPHLSVLGIHSPAGGLYGKPSRQSYPDQNLQQVVKEGWFA